MPRHAGQCQHRGAPQTLRPTGSQRPKNPGGAHGRLRALYIGRQASKHPELHDTDHPGLTKRQARLHHRNKRTSKGNHQQGPLRQPSSTSSGPACCTSAGAPALPPGRGAQVKQAPQHAARRMAWQGHHRGSSVKMAQVVSERGRSIESISGTTGSQRRVLATSASSVRPGNGATLRGSTCCTPARPAMVCRDTTWIGHGHRS